jgi:UDP-N-acetylmuramate--alanine ligase
MSTSILDTATRIHFIGIGGIGMSALARHLLHEKKVVSGSDQALTPLTKALSSEGVQVFATQTADNITKDIDLIIYTEAMDEESEEMQAARASRAPMVNYFEALGMAMNPYYLIAVAGTHGKTTTSAMLVDVFEAAGKDPTAVIGSLRSKTKSNYRFGKSKYAIVEACEYKRDFLHLRPDVLVITNVEHEHVDYYKDLKDVQNAFKTLVGQVNEGGVVVTDVKHPNIAPILAGAEASVVDYQQYLDPSMSMKQPGVHNRLNAAAALAVAECQKLPLAEAKVAIEQFAGTWRRFEYKGNCNGAPVYDDYGHHPTELIATIAGARELYPNKRLVIAFQPHTYTRTKALFNDFAKALGSADAVVLLPIYAAREENTSKVSARELLVKALEYIRESEYFDTFAAAETYIRQTLTEQDVLVVMGAGDVTELSSKLVR